MRRDALFAGGELKARLKVAEKKMADEVQALDSAGLLNIDVGEFTDYLVATHGFEVPQLLTDQIEVDEPAESKVDVSGDPRRAIVDRSRPVYVPGTTFTYHIPFTGDQELMLLTPSTTTTIWPEGKVTPESEIVWSFTAATPQANPNHAFQQNLERIEKYVGFVRQDVEPWMGAFPGRVRSTIEARRQRLIFDRERAAQLGYPIRRREDAARTYSVPLVRKKVAMPPERATQAAGAELEPILAMEIYDDMLRVMATAVEMIGRSPKTYRNLDENSLRDQLLLALNNQYEGGATGETFNYEGKTDIFIRINGRVVFIGECKFWRGPKALLAAIDQLLSYLSWHDTKAAVVLFHRGRNLTAVLEQIPGVVRRHSAWEKDLAFESASAYRALLMHPGDEGRNVTLTVLAFQVPADDDDAK
jgi:hypothetical protein